MAVAEWISVIATLIAAASFVWGVVSWRASFLGQKKIELAEQVYELFLTCADHVRAIRNPMGYQGEGATRQRLDNETPQESQVFDQAYVVVERLEARIEDFNRLFSLMPRFQFYFGEPSAAPIIVLGKIVQEIRLASSQLRRHWLRQGGHFADEQEFQRHLERTERHEAIFWEGAAEEDPINPRLNKAVNSIKMSCTNALNPQPNFWRGIRHCSIKCWNFIKIPRTIPPQ